MNNRHPMMIVSAFLFTIVVPLIGYVSFGPWPAVLFLIGYLCGFIFWLVFPTRASFSRIKFIYWIAFLLFLLHRVEEKKFGFFSKLSEITGVAVPEVFSAPIIILVIVSVGAWIIGPLLYSRGNSFGHYLIWTFFASMGVTELAHFVLPLFTLDPYGYFPGMLTVIPLAPVAWWGMFRITIT